MLQESRTHCACSVKHFGPRRHGGTCSLPRSPAFVVVVVPPSIRVQSTTRDAPALDAQIDGNGFRPESGGFPPCFWHPRSASRTARLSASGSRAERRVGRVETHAPSGGREARTTNGPPRRTTLRAVRGSPEQIRTAASALRGRRPRPLDDGAVALGGEDSNPQ